MNNDFDVAVLHSLRVTDLPPSTVDLPRAARTGRRRLRIRYAVTAGVVSAVVLLSTVVIAAVIPRPAAPPATPPPSPVPLPTSTIAPALGPCAIGPDTHPWMDRHPWVTTDDTWRVAVYLEGIDAIRWIDGRSERIRGVPSGFMVADASRSGDFAGGTNTNDKAWVYRNGRFTRLAMPPGGQAIYVRDMNDRGDIVGSVRFDDPVAVVWPAGHPDKPRVLESPDHLNSSPAGIADDGTVVGEVFAGTSRAPYLWHADGTGEYLPLPAEWATPAQAPWGSGEGGAVVLLAGDWAVGPSVRWNIRTGRADLIKGLYVQGVPDMYGRLFGTTPPPELRPVVWINGTIEPIPQPAGERVDTTLIRLDGRHLSGQNPAGHWIEWTCGTG